MNLMQIKRYRKPYTLPDDAPTVAFLRCYRSVWISNPLALFGLVPTDPRHDPDQAMREAFDLLNCRAGQAVAA